MIEAVQVEIRDFSGRLVLQQPLQTITEIDAKDWARGAYWIGLRWGSWVTTKQIILR
jgi:hypothetical protein